MTKYKIFRSLSCITISETTKHETAGNKALKEFREKPKDNLWKTFSEAIDDEQELLKKLYQSENSELVKSKQTRKTEKRKIQYGYGKLSKKKADIGEIYQKALAKLPKFNHISEQQNEDNCDFDLTKFRKSNMIQESSQSESMERISCSIPDLLKLHKEVYFNSEFQEQNSISLSFHNRPLPPIPQNSN